MKGLAMRDHRKDNNQTFAGIIAKYPTIRPTS